MQELELSYNGRKALCVHIGDEAGSEITELLQTLIARVEKLEKTKVDIMPIVPMQPSLQTSPLRRAA